MADPRKNAEAPTTAANKASALRWALGIAAVFIVGVIAWWISGLPGGEPPELTPQHEPGYEQGESGNQPPAVIPNQDSGGNPPATPEPAGPGTQ